MNGYSTLIKKITARLKTLDIKVKGSMFHYVKDGNVGMINFQKSRDSKPHEVKFTIDLGISNTKLRDFFEGKNASLPDAITQCHWRKRAGHLLPIQKDFWWEFTEVTDEDELYKEIENVILTICLPEIDKYLPDEALQRLWLQGIGPGLTKVMRLEYLAILLTINKETKSAEGVVRELIDSSRKQPYQDSVDEVIGRLSLIRIT